MGETKEKFNFYDTVVSWAIVIWAVASIAFLVYFSGMNQVTFAIMTFGQLFVVMGLILLVRKKLSGVVLLFTGFASVIFPAINEWAVLFSESAVATSSIFPIFMSVAICACGIAMLVVPGILEKVSKSKCNLKVVAEVVDVKTTDLADGKVAKSPVYSYEVKGQIYTACQNKYVTANCANVGDKTELYVNENKPEQVYFETSKASLMLIYILGFAFFIAGVGMSMIIMG